MHRNLRETTQARKCLEEIGTPPIPRQNMADNLSTFSAHIVHPAQGEQGKSCRFRRARLRDRPGEGMGIAIAILEELRKSECLFLVTTHYPEVKEYAGEHEEIENARMAFDRESLRPLYSLEIGLAGESCALYIAKKLGFPTGMLKTAARAAYGTISDQLTEELDLDNQESRLIKESAPRIEFINQKRLKLKVKAAELYPEDYDFLSFLTPWKTGKPVIKWRKGIREIW